MKKLTYGTGATRHDDVKPRYDLISPHGLERLALIYAEGAAIHGDRNWEKGMPVGDTLNRAIRHYNLYMAGDKTEDHLAKAAWGFFTAMHMERCLPEMVDVPGRK